MVLFIRVGILLRRGSNPIVSIEPQWLTRLILGKDMSDTCVTLDRDSIAAISGLFGMGTVFKVAASGAETLLHSFAGADGKYPYGSLIRDSAGNIYGTTFGGGVSGKGTVFKLDTSGKEPLLHSFTGGRDGSHPYSGLVLDAAGNLYGTTYGGGAFTCGRTLCGTVFKLDATGHETVLHNFSGGTDGSGPCAGVVRDSAGNLYGTTLNGGSFNLGTVFKVDTRGKETVLWTFDGTTDGGNPFAGLVRDSAGNLYGTASSGGTSFFGTVFKLTPYDSLGHSVGDLLLKDVAERLKKTAREQDTVARLAGDEFLIVLTDVKDIPDAAVAAERFMNAMTAEFVVQGHPLSISCSLGISIFPEHGADAETLIKNADEAMYCAKDYGRDNFRFFTEDMNAQAVERLTLESSLRLALDRQELFLVYQPQMDIGTGRITGLEALLRWQHPELGLVPPDKFIRIAENSGLIMPIGEWVLSTACSQARKWQDEGLPAMPVAVNVSAVQFRQEGFRELIKRVLHETGLASEYLELELTESLLLSNADVTFSVLQELKAMGLKLAIDDFGTGYSSFSYLKHFPVSKLKIDRSFVRDVAVNPDDAAITSAIISMAKSLNLKVIAEGVENEAQMSFLRAHHCDEIQGYYFSMPLSTNEVVNKLRGTVGQGQGPERRAFIQSIGE